MSGYRWVQTAIFGIATLVELAIFIMSCVGGGAGLNFWAPLIVMVVMMGCVVYHVRRGVSE